jgi:hypothetical protein
MWSAEGAKLELSFVRESVKRGLETGGRRIAIVGAVTREHLEETRLCALVNCEVWK